MEHFVPLKEHLKKCAHKLRKSLQSLVILDAVIKLLVQILLKNVKSLIVVAALK